MTSATAQIARNHAANALALGIVLGKTRVRLDALPPKQLEMLIAEQLAFSDMKDLREFKELRDALSCRGDEPLQVGPRLVLNTEGFSQLYPFTLKSHVVLMSRGYLSERRVYRRHESQDETEDRTTADAWGRSAYLHRGEASLLFLRRLPETAHSESVLVEVHFFYAKVPAENLWLIEAAGAKPVPIPGFCKRFRERAPDVARDLIWDLASVYRQTAEALAANAQVMAKKAQALGWLGDRIG